MTFGEVMASTSVVKDASVQQDRRTSGAPLLRHPSSINYKRQVRRNGVHRTNTVIGVTDQARRVLEELLARESGGGEGGGRGRRPIRREVPLSEPGPRIVGAIGAGFPPPPVKDVTAIEDLISPISDIEESAPDRRPPGRHKRRPSNETSVVLESSSPSPLEDRVVNEDVVRRKKKSFFVRAKERLRESIRRHGSNPVTPADEKGESGPDLKDRKKGKIWTLSLRKKKKKMKKESNSEAAIESTGQSRINSNGHSTKRSVSEHLSLASRISLPSDRSGSAIDQTKSQGPTRSQSTFETRIHYLTSNEVKFIQSHIISQPDNRPDVLSSTISSSSQIPPRKSGNHSMRRNLQLDGLVLNRPETHQWSVKAPLAQPEDSRVTPTEDEVDGGLIEALRQTEVFPQGQGASTSSVGPRPGHPPPPAFQQQQSWWNDRPLVHATTKPFNEKSEEERSELFGRIADQLDVIGDAYCYGPSVHRQKEEGHGASNFDMRRAPSSSSLSDMANVVSDLVRNTTYDTFQSLVNRSIGSEPGIDQIAAMFRLTKCAVKLAGIGTSAAGKIKDMSIRYFADHFAGWMVDEGGWESVVEDSATDMDLD